MPAPIATAIAPTAPTPRGSRPATAPGHAPARVLALALAAVAAGCTAPPADAPAPKPRPAPATAAPAADAGAAADTAADRARADAPALGSATTTAADASAAATPTPDTAAVSGDTMATQDEPPAARSAAGFDPSALAIVLEPAWSGFDNPVLLVGAGDGSGRRFVVEQPGRVRLIAGGDVRQGPYLDLRDRVGSGASEQGLLGLAFHPRFADNGRLFVDYTNQRGHTVVSELRAAPDAETVDPATERVLLRVDQPATNHNGGHLAFGPDGMLYIGLGDGGGANDTYGNGQRPNTLLAKLLRIDVDAGEPYAIPPDNPFPDGPFAPETWAWGLRNPWRFSFDRATGDLYIGDVGQSAWEEIDVAPAGSPGGTNYGWPLLEGRRCRDTGDEPADCGASADMTLPVAVYGHDEGCSVTGGFVSRDPGQPLLEGVYLYGDYCSGRIWGLWRDGDGGWRSALLADTEHAISSFGEDDDGALYVLDLGGTVLRVAARQP